MSSRVSAKKISHEQDAKVKRLARLYTRDELEEFIKREVEKKERELEKKVWKKIKHGHFQLTEEDYKIKFLLNFDLAQCKSKTKLALSFIALQQYQNQQKYKNSKNNVKLVSIVFTNNSLLEGIAWKERTAAKFNDGNIVVQRLASDVKKKGNKKKDNNNNNKDFSKGNELLSAFATYAGQKKSETIVGDVLIMCNHPTRIDDMIRVIDTLDGFDAKRTGIKYKYNIYFDECDQPNCLSQMTRFIKEIYYRNLNHLIDQIQLITATPAVEMHKKLKQITPDADKLFNIKHKLEFNEPRVKDYRTIIDQPFIPFEGPEDPVDYIGELINSHRELKTLLLNPTPENENRIKYLKQYENILIPGNVLFIPSHHYTEKHEHMANLDIWKDNGYWILILNGKHKELRSPLGRIRNVKKDLDAGGELRDILREWRKDNPKAGLVITGKQVLERGLTFLTDGFNFTHMIVSRYFAKKIHALIQLVGRGQGNEKYVDKFTVIMPQALYDCVKNYIDESEKLLKDNPEFYEEDILAKLDKKEDSKNLNKNDIMFEEFNNEADALARINSILDKAKTHPNWDQAERFRPSFRNIKKREENGFYKERVLGHNNRGNYKVYSYEEMFNTRGEHDSGQATRTYKTHICYKDPEDPATIRYVICYPKSHLEKINETETNEVEDDESKEDDNTNFFDNMA